MQYVSKRLQWGISSNNPEPRQKWKKIYNILFRFTSDYLYTMPRFIYVEDFWNVLVFTAAQTERLGTIRIWVNNYILKLNIYADSWD